MGIGFHAAGISPSGTCGHPMLSNAMGVARMLHWYHEYWPPKGIAMSGLSRIGVALDSNLLDRFDRHIANQGYSNRSEAFRDLIRDRLASSAAAQPEAVVVGTVTLVYDHHARGLPERLISLQHEFHDLIVSTCHTHLDHHACLEAVIVRGKSSAVQKLADRLISMKGIQHGRLVMSVPNHSAK
jgi:CopG family nickel-responsive transcriptional regulator